MNEHTIELDTLCSECKQDIRAGAIRCHHCTAIQGWRRWLRLPLLAGGFVLTIVSIWAADPIKQFLDPQVAVIQPAILEGDYEHLKVVLTNTGSRAATLHKIEITGAAKVGYPSTWFLKSDQDGKVLESGKSTVVSASNGGIIPAFVDRFRSAILKRELGVHENCHLRIIYIDVNAKESTIVYPFMCDMVSIDYRGGLDDQLNNQTAGEAAQ